MNPFIMMALLQFIKEMSRVQQLKFKYLKGLPPTILGEVFKINETILHDLRMRNELYARNPKTVRYGTETISFLSAKLWALVPQNIKDSSCLPCFEKSIRKSKPNCPSCLSKIFLQHVRFSQLNSSPLFSVFNLFEFHITCSCPYYVFSVRAIVT